MDDIRDRIQRIYAAIGETFEEEISKFPVMQSVTDRWIFVHQDFSGGLTQPQISNIAFTAVHALAHFADHLHRWAKKGGNAPKNIEYTIENCSALEVIIDLSNRDKHGGTPRDGGRSGKSPRVENLTRVLRLTPGAAPGSGVPVQFTTSGPVVKGSGSASVVVTGDVLADDGAPIADLHSLFAEALTAWEKLMSDWGLLGDRAV